MSDDQTVLYVGLRRSPLEWLAELEAATHVGLLVHVASDSDVTHIGLPEHQLSSFTSAGSAAELASKIIAGVGQLPSAVMCWGDRYVEVTAHIASELGLRGVGVAGASTCTNKIAQRRALEPYGLNPAWRPGSTIEDLAAAVDALGLPLVFKLAHSSGGRGTRLLTESTDLDEVFQLTALNYTPSTAFLVEEFVDGSEHSVSGITDGQTTKILGVSDKLVNDSTFDTWATIVPSSRTDSEVERMKQAATQAIYAVGVKSSGFHVDLRLTPSGPIVLEVGARLGGDLINSHLIPIASGERVMPYQALVDVLTTGSLPEASTYTGAAAMIVLPAAHRPMDEIVRHALEHPGVRAAIDWSTPDSTSVAVVISTTNRHDIAAATDQVRSWVQK